MHFEHLDVGEHFRLLNSSFIKIDDKVYNNHLSRRPPNAINLDNKHRVVIGNNVIIEKEAKEK